MRMESANAIYKAYKIRLICEYNYKSCFMAFAFLIISAITISVYLEILLPFETMFIRTHDMEISKNTSKTNLPQLSSISKTTIRESNETNQQKICLIADCNANDIRLLSFALGAD